MYTQTPIVDWKAKLHELEEKKKRNYILTTALLSAVVVFQLLFTIMISVAYFSATNDFLSFDKTTDPVGDYQKWLMPVAIVFQYISVVYLSWGLFVMLFKKGIQKTYRHSVIGSIYIVAFCSLALAAPVLFMHWELFLCHVKNFALNHYDHHVAFAMESVFFIAILAFYAFVLFFEVSLLFIKMYLEREMELCENGENKSMIYMDQGIDGFTTRTSTNVIKTVIPEPVIAPDPLPMTFADTSTMPLPAGSRKIKWKVEDKNAMLDGKIWRDIDYSGQLATNNRNQIIRNKEKQAIQVKEEESRKTRALTPMDPSKTQALSTIDAETRAKIWRVDDANAKMNGQIWRRDKFSSKIAEDKRNNIVRDNDKDKK